MSANLASFHEYSMNPILIHQVLDARIRPVFPEVGGQPPGADLAVSLNRGGAHDGRMRTPLECEWWLHTETVSGRLQASLWLSRRVGASRLPVAPASASSPHVTLTVTRPSFPEARPVVEASIAGIATLMKPTCWNRLPPRRATWSGAWRGLVVAYGAIALQPPGLEPGTFRPNAPWRQPPIPNKLPIN